MAWAMVGAAAVTVVGGAIAGSAKSKSDKQQMQMSEQDQELNFQRQAWLAQQQRAWQLQDRQYKQQAIGGFSNYWKTGGDVKPPTQDTSGLMNFDPNQKNSLGAPHPAPTPAPAPPLSQLNGGVGLPPSATLPRMPQ